MAMRVCPVAKGVRLSCANDSPRCGVVPAIASFNQGNTMSTQFNRAEGMRRHEEGIELIEMANKRFMANMRIEARFISRVYGEVHIDDLRKFAVRMGIKPKSSNAWGAIFRGKGWTKIGSKPSSFVSNHGHVSPIWRWDGDVTN